MPAAGVAKQVFAELVGGKGCLAGCPIRTTELQPLEESGMT
jgi:hypothetical protein